jgi:hypothetical protein
MQGESSEQQIRNDLRKSNSSGAGETVDTMLEFNSLQYNMWPDLTVCVDRTMKNSYFQTSEYTSDQKTGFCILNTGSDFIQGRTSYLVFDLEFDGDLPEGVVPLWGAAGSAYNLIRRLTITDRSGNELERVRNVGRLVNLQMRHTQSSAFLNSVGSCFLNPAEVDKSHSITSAYAKTRSIELKINTAGNPPYYYKKICPKVNDGEYANVSLGSGLYNIDQANPSIYNNSDVNHEIGPIPIGTFQKYGRDRACRSEAAEYSVAGRRWCLPLRFMSGLFDYDQLLPMQVTSGLRLEFEWESVQDAFRFVNVRGKDNFNTGNPVDATPDMSKIKYLIKNARIVTDSCKLTDSVVQELNSRSAQNGLEIVYRTFFTTVASPARGTQELNIESRKAVSRCFGAFAAFYRNYSDQTERYIRDYNETLPMNALEWQWRAGNLYFPNQMMKASGPDNTTKLKAMAAETFMHTMRMFYKMKHTYEEPHVSINNYSNTFNGPGPAHMRFNIQAGTLPAPDFNDDHKYPEPIEKIAAPQCNLYPLDLERSTVQDLSGLPLNNSRVLNFQWKQIPGTDLLEDIGQSNPTQINWLDGAELPYADWNSTLVPMFNGESTKSSGYSSDTFDVNLFMQYLKVARVFIDNIQVEE